MSYTIRFSKDRNTRIITFKKSFLAALLGAHPRASLLIVSKLLEYLRANSRYQLPHVVEYDQREKLHQLINNVNDNPIDDYELWLISKWITDGVRIEDNSLIVLLNASSRAFNMLTKTPNHKP